METTNPSLESPLPPDAIEAGKAARLLKCHVSTIHRWVQKGKIPGWYRGRQPKRLLVSRADVLEMIAPVKPADGGPAPECKAINEATDRWTESVLKRFGLA
ncbi:MAG: helix-turn-helix domain-containing protein [Planctomycetia bacterium]|nr:helix-turn-helix domain-containing protein [Planctomycetia bacterium]